MSSRRLDVRSAAEELGVSVDAVRMRVRRGSLASEKDPEGHVWVWVELSESDESPPNTDEPETSQTTSSSNWELVEELREQNAYLQELLDAEREARTEENRRKDHIIAGLVQRVPELEASETSQDEEEPLASSAGGSHVSWWRRLLGR